MNQRDAVRIECYGCPGDGLQRFFNGRTQQWESQTCSVCIGRGYWLDPTTIRDADE